MKTPDSIRVFSEHLRSGYVLTHPIFRDSGEVLLPAGTVMTPQIKEDFRQQQILNILMHPEDAAVMFVSAGRARESPGPTEPATAFRPEDFSPSAEVSAEFEAFSAATAAVIENVGPPLKDRANRIGCQPYNLQQQELLTQQFATTKKLMDTMIRHAVAGLNQDTRAITTVAKRASAELTRDADQAYAASSEVADNPGLTERAIRTSVLAMAIAIELEWDENLVREVGECGFVQDWGMFRLPEELRNKQTELTSAERQLIAQHPLHTFDLLSKMQNISPAVRLAAVQVHEKLDGSGYPRGLVANQIHPYAKVLHVADTYVSLTEATWGRPAYVPYDVMAYLLSQVRLKKVSSEVMKGMLEVVSLFPIGSHVVLSDGTEARVLRRGHGAYTEPVVQRLDENRTLRVDAPHQWLVDLAGSGIKVSAPLPHPTKRELRLDDQAIERLDAN